jgi:hypothetical protein
MRERMLKTGDRVLVNKLSYEHPDRPEFGRRGTVVEGEPRGVLKNTHFCAVLVDGLETSGSFIFVVRRLELLPAIEQLAEI